MWAKKVDIVISVIDEVILIKNRYRFESASSTKLNYLTWEPICAKIFIEFNSVVPLLIRLNKMLRWSRFEWNIYDAYLFEKSPVDFSRLKN